MESYTAAFISAKHLVTKISIRRGLVHCLEPRIMTDVSAGHHPHPIWNGNGAR